MTDRGQRPRRSACFRWVGLLCAAALLAGCYQHVISARGPGADAVDTHEPNLKSERIPVVDDLEDAMFGKKQPIEPRRTRR